MAPWLPSGRIRPHEHERGGFSAGALTSDGLKQKTIKRPTGHILLLFTFSMNFSTHCCFKDNAMSENRCINVESLLKAS